MGEQSQQVLFITQCNKIDYFTDSDFQGDGNETVRIAQE